MTPPGGRAVPEGVEASPGFLILYRKFGANYRWWASLVGMIGSFATLLTSTIVNIAIPDIMGALGMTLEEAQWLATTFLAAGTVTMLATAWFIRVYGIAATYIGAMLIFVASSGFGAAASTMEALLIARVVQGAAAGLAMPISMVVTAQVFPLQQRGFAMGLMGVGTILAPALGPTLGGYLVDHLSWRWVFIAAIPFVVISLPMARLFFPGRDSRGPIPPFDWLGALLCTMFIVALLIGLTEVQHEGWYDRRALISLALGLAALVAWIGWETYTPEPLLELRLFLNPRFVAAALVTFTVGIALYGSTYIFPLFLQQISRLIATEAGVLMAPAGLVMAALFPVAGRLADAFSHRAMILIGLALFAISIVPMAYADTLTPVLQMLLWYCLGRVGLALIFPSLNAAAINPLTVDLIPHGSGTINFLRQLGGAFGINFISLTMQARLATHVDDLNATQTWDNPATMEMMRLSMEQLRFFGLQGYQGFEMSFGYVLAVTGFQASTLSYRDGFLFVGLVTLVTLIPGLFIAGRRQQLAAVRS